MFKKSDPWQAGIKIVTKFLGFDVQQQTSQKQSHQGHNGLFSLKSTNENISIPKSQQKSYQMKQKWRKLMKFPSKVKQKQVIQLLRQGSAMEDQTWIWMLKNTQKISPHLYSSKKQQLHQIIYPKIPLCLLVKNSGINNIQNQDFEQPLQFQMSVKQSLKQPKKRKVSITKSSIFIKNQSQLTGRSSLNSQASTFSSQTHNSSELISPFECNQQTKLLDGLLCKKYSQTQSPQRSFMKSSFISNSSMKNQTLNFHQSERPNFPFNQQYSSFESFIQSLPSKINHPVLTDIIGSFLLHREDFAYSVTLFNMAASFYYYTNSSQIKTFILLNHVACSQFFVHYLTKNFALSSQILLYIAHKVRSNCPSAVFLKNFRLQNFIQNWLYGFLYSICQNGTQVKEKIVGYLLINGFSVDSIIKLCESLVTSLGRIINQGYEDRIYECLQNPKLYIDKQVLFDHLLQYED